MQKMNKEDIYKYCFLIDLPTKFTIMIVSHFR